MQINKNHESGFLLDTHTWVWLINGAAELSPKTIRGIEQAAKLGKIFIAAISVWELATLAVKKRLILRTSISEWVSEALVQPGVELLPLSPEISIESTQLPNSMHGDPADRIIVATARIKRITVLTRDSKILRYADEGYVQALKI